MIDVDISHVWGAFSLPDLLSIENEIAEAHQNLMESETAQEGLCWHNLSEDGIGDILKPILSVAARIRETAHALVVVGVGGGCRGARGVISLLRGSYYNFTGANPCIFFTGGSLSTRQWEELTALLEGKDFSVLVVSKSGTTLEPALSFRALRELLVFRWGAEEAAKRIYTITDPQSALWQISQEHGWTSLPIPAGMSGRFSVFSAAGLLPMAVAGLDIDAFLRGAYEGKKTYGLRSFENPAWLYAAVRILMYRFDRRTEVLASFEPGFSEFGVWWQQLFAGAEGKSGKGLFPAVAEYPADLYSLGQLIQEGQRSIFETILRFDPPAVGYTIRADEQDPDGLNCIAGRTLDFVQEFARIGTIAAHEDGGAGMVTMDCGARNEQTLGELVYLMELSCCISAYAQGVDPFEQSAVDLHKRNMLRLLERPVKQ